MTMLLQNGCRRDEYRFDGMSFESIDSLVLELPDPVKQERSVMSVLHDLVQECTALAWCIVG